MLENMQKLKNHKYFGTPRILRWDTMLDGAARRHDRVLLVLKRRMEPFRSFLSVSLSVSQIAR